MPAHREKNQDEVAGHRIPGGLRKNPNQRDLILSMTP
jgi:hypothetical protein